MNGHVPCAFRFGKGFISNSPPSEASIKQLLEVSRVHKMLDAFMRQMDTMMNQVLQNTMSEMQSLMQPVMEKMHRTQQHILAQIQAEKAKHG
jgi:hypothetical protein